MLGSSFRRKRNFIFKIIIGIPVIWFSIIGFSVVLSGNGPFPDVHNNHADIRDSPPQEPQPTPKVLRDDAVEQKEEEDEYDRKVREQVEKLRTKINKDPDQIHGGQVPNLEAPNPDHERLIEKIKLDAMEDLRKKEEERRKERMRDDGDLRFNPKVQQARTYPKVELNLDPNNPGKRIEMSMLT